MPHDPSGSHDEQQQSKMIGTPMEDGLHFPGKQNYPDTCSIRCQEYILETFTGQEFDENALFSKHRHMAGTRPVKVLPTKLSVISSNYTALP